ncbi:hypothetical protein [Cryobacterium sp. PAMC25264]|uniref:hypothetical protein n=1 Tax=Cryobacterium sp. PAMC25264 TaxID=2861288 RepID=UPI001C6300B6|nr:hypothetical protein [Cryobacterium sp. PAMC25264]QYF74482.1 hypothetical protein KY500_04605 [Cryobacterium sp. PAMC25264]
MTTTSASQPPHPHQIVHFGRLPRLPLEEGEGGTREIWTASVPGLDFIWQLKLVELRGPTATLHAPSHMHQLVVGMSGPQVLAGPVNRQLPLRRDQAMLVRSPTTVFRRPRLRMAGASRVLVLTFVSDGPDPTFSFDTFSGVATLPPDTRAVIVLEGALDLAGEAVPSESALILAARAPRPLVVGNARVVILSLDDSTVAVAETP